MGHGVTNGALRYETAETVRKEGEAVMCTASKQCALSVGQLGSHYDTHVAMLHERLLHFLSRRYTPACLKVRYRYVAPSPGPADGGGRRWCAGIPDTIVLLMMMMIHLDQTLAACIK